MLLHFRCLCELFDIVDGLRAKGSRIDILAIYKWFNKHETDISRLGPDAVAFLSCLFPEYRPDRVLGVRQRDLERIIQSAHGLGQTRMSELQCWRNQDGPDFTSAVQHILSAAESTSRSQETVILNKIEKVLNQITSRSPFSSSFLKEKACQTNLSSVD